MGRDGGIYTSIELAETMDRVLCYLVATASVDAFHILRNHR